MANGNAVETNHSHSFEVDDSKNSNYSDQKFELGSDGIYSANPKPVLEEVIDEETGEVTPLTGEMMADVLLDKEAKVSLTRTGKGLSIQFHPTKEEQAQGANPKSLTTVAFINKVNNQKMTIAEWAVIKKSIKKSCTKAVIAKKTVNSRFGQRFSKLARR